MKNRIPLDIYDAVLFPDKAAYLSAHGWHFSKKACELACGQLIKKNITTGKEERYGVWSKEQVDDLMKKFSVKIDNDAGYDYVYLHNETRAYSLGNSIQDEYHVILRVKEVLDGPNSVDGEVFRWWYASMVAKGIPVDWKEIM